MLHQSPSDSPQLIAKLKNISPCTYSVVHTLSSHAPIYGISIFRSPSKHHHPIDQQPALRMPLPLIPS